MKKNLLNYSFVLGLGALIGLSSCSDDERPLPSAEAEFVVATTFPEAHLPVYFENNSLNAAYHVWDFGDGEKDSAESVSVSHIYDEAGSYLVKLRAYNEDGAFKEVERNVAIGQRYLTSAFILNISMKDTLGNMWDEDGSGPDVFWQIYPTDASSQDDVVAVFIEDLNGGGEDDFETPIGISTQNFIPQDYLLSNKNYVILLEEVDTVEGVAEYVDMAGVLFNPVVQDEDHVATTYKYSDGTGSIQIPFIVIDQYQFILNFEIR